MKAKKIWIATHPEEPLNIKVSFYERDRRQVTIRPNHEAHHIAYVEYKEYILIEVES